MKELENRIIKDGQILGDSVIKVDSFLNHRIDAEFTDAMAKEFARLFDGKGINKILTVEAGGIAVASLTALRMRVPLVFAKKSRASNMSAGVYSSRVHSFTRGADFDIVISRQYLGPKDRVLFLDDFLANGAAAKGIIDICLQAGAELAGIGICIEKCFQPGGDMLREMGYHVESLAMIDSIEGGHITFRE